MTKVILLFNTIKFLKPIQVYYRLYYFARRKIRSIYDFKYPLTLQSSISSHISVDHHTFTFLNLSHTFKNGIDWNFAEYGKLWTYNLTYFDFLQQKKMSKEEGLTLIHDFIDKRDKSKSANQDKGFVNEFKAFKTSVQSGTPAISFKSIYNTTKTIFKILESIRTGNVVSVNE